MRRLRPKVPDSNLTNGPGKLTKALGIDKSLNEVDMTKRGLLFIAESDQAQFDEGRSVRVGISQGTDLLWRFYITGNPYVSKR
jgi:DNA-3-methyladenine glycosylase